jgi:AraC family L-rhamnose operon regulatory protein RhaS
VVVADSCEPLKEAAARGSVRLSACARGEYPGHRLPAAMLPETRTVGYWDADHRQSWGLDWHYNEGIEVTYVSRGQTYFAVDDGEYWLKRGEIGITRPWQRHRIGNPHIAASRLHWLILDVGVRRPNQTWNWPRWLASSAGDIAALTTMLSHNEHPVWPADGEVELHFAKLAEVVDGWGLGFGESHLRLHISGLIVALTDLLGRQRPELDTSLSSAQRTVELFLQDLPNHVDQPWDLASMAAECGLGRSRFAHYCRESTNMSPVEYLNVCRLDAARRLLTEDPHLSVTDVALASGFSSSQYFTTVFHQHTGQTPRDFRHARSALSA